GAGHERDGMVFEIERQSTQQGEQNQNHIHQEGRNAFKVLEGMQYAVKRVARAAGKEFCSRK
ncbi:MAG: hypothetical protein C0410_13840, partial [Anaerolinea sp.]|nr:hypothetical protein [Anaerolinea sp.]